MKRTISILSIFLFAFIMTVAAFGQTTSAQQTKPQHFSKRQLNALIAEAKTPTEHQRIAQFYEAKAQDYLAQAKEHEQMVAAYKANPSLTAKSQGKHHQPLRVLCSDVQGPGLQVAGTRTNARTNGQGNRTEVIQD
jgi:hypothetical protein